VVGGGATALQHPGVARRQSADADLRDGLAGLDEGADQRGDLVGEVVVVEAVLLEAAGDGQRGVLGGVDLVELRIPIKTATGFG